MCFFGGGGWFLYFFFFKPWMIQKFEFTLTDWQFEKSRGTEAELESILMHFFFLPHFCFRVWRSVECLNCVLFSPLLLQCLHRLRHRPPHSITGWLSAFTDRAWCQICHAQLFTAGPICQHLCQVSLSPWRGERSWHGAQRPTRQQLAVPAAKRGAQCCHPPAAMVCHPCQQPTGLCSLGIRRSGFRR